MKEPLAKHQQAIHYAHRALTNYLEDDILLARRYLVQAMAILRELIDTYEDTEVLRMVAEQYSKLEVIYNTLFS